MHDELSPEETKTDYELNTGKIKEGEAIWQKRRLE